MEPTPLMAQQAAIQDVRAQYERGELSYEAFRRALDALVLARDADECQAILRELPQSPLAPLAALEPRSASAPAAASEPRHKWLVAFMGSVNKRRRPWRLLPATHAVAFMGDVQLDLSLAELPPQARLQITCIMGSVTLYMPRNVRVSVRSMVLLGDVSALGEHTSGVVGFGQEEHTPATEQPATEIEIEAWALMGSVKVALTDGHAVSISELVRDTLQAAAEGVRRGMLQPPSSRTSLGAGNDG
jgi:Cell wall-active antibiotics response 4TMS YvqF